MSAQSYAGSAWDWARRRLSIDLPDDGTTNGYSFDGTTEEKTGCLNFSHIALFWNNLDLRSGHDAALKRHYCGAPTTATCTTSNFAFSLNWMTSQFCPRSWKKRQTWNVNGRMAQPSNFFSNKIRIINFLWITLERCEVFPDIVRNVMHSVIDGQFNIFDNERRKSPQWWIKSYNSRISSCCTILS